MSKKAPPKKIQLGSKEPTTEYYTGPYPSPYGSHSSMIDEEETNKLEDNSLVALKDEKGTYITFRKRLDSGLADPSRFSRT